MADPTLHFYFREPTVDTNMPLTDGTIKVEGFDFKIVKNEDEADAWDCGFAARVRAHAQGAHHLSIPAFPNRKFRQSYIFINSRSGIESPRDLEGKRVGIMQWDNTAGVWARGALQNYYGVELTRINWLAGRVKGGGVAQGIRIQKLEPGGGGDIDNFLDRLLVEGALDAVIGPNVLSSISRRDARVRRLFRDYKTEEQTYFKKTGIFPISHVVTLKQEFVDAHPNAPVALLKAFRRARDEAFSRLEGADPQVLVISWAAAAVDEQRALMGENYWAYDIENNRRSLDALTQYAYEQGLSPVKIDYESFFAPDAAALPGM
jgi:4,5-dihydroxyphthalate decarboxylase